MGFKSSIQHVFFYTRLQYLIKKYLIQYPLFNPYIYIYFFIGGGCKSHRGIRVGSYDPDDPASQGGGNGGYRNLNGGGSADRSLGTGGAANQRVATISHSYNEKTMLLSSDDEFQ